MCTIKGERGREIEREIEREREINKGMRRGKRREGNWRVRQIDTDRQTNRKIERELQT